MFYIVWKKARSKKMFVLSFSLFQQQAAVTMKAYLWRQEILSIKLK